MDLTPGAYTLVPGEYSLTVSAAVVTPPPVVTPPAPGPGIITQGGQLGPGFQGDDWSSNCTLTHTSAGVHMKCTGPWAIWQPYATMLGGTPMTPAQSQDGTYSVAGFTKLLYTIIAEQANSDMQTRLVPAGVEDATTPLLLLSEYGTWVTGKPSTFIIPLSDLGIGGAAFPGNLIRKIGLQDQSSTAANGGASYEIVSAEFA